jgi:4-hydroxybenzoate polyprenyltransferase
LTRFPEDIDFVATSPLPGRRRRAWLQLLRPANIATAPADVLAGAAAAGALLPPSPSLAWLAAASCALYGGGIVLNDFFDRHLDAVERPERPIPSGAVRASFAAALGFSLLGAGVAAAMLAGGSAWLVAIAIAGAVLLYDARAKHHPIAGPVAMGTCRALNLLLGMAAAPSAIGRYCPLAIIPLVYVAAVTVVSRGEVHGSRKPVARTALVMIAGVIVALVALATSGGRAAPLPSPDRIATILVAAWLAWRVLPRFAVVAGDPRPELAGRAVRTGVLSLVLVDAVIAGAYTGIMGIPAVLATGIVAWLLARLFAVT